MVMPIADFIEITDSLGLMAAKLTAIAATTPATDLLAAATANIGRVLDLSDSRDIAAILKAFNDLETASATPTKTTRELFGTVFSGLVGNIGSLTAYLQAQNGLVSRAFADAYNASQGTNAIPPQYVMPPAVVTLATFTLSGAGAGTFGASGTIDVAQYGAVQCEIEATTTIGGSAIVATLTMVKFDGTTEAKTVTMPASSTSGTKVSIGTATDKYKDCSGITVTGGAAAEAFKVQNKVLRTPVI